MVPRPARRLAAAVVLVLAPPLVACGGDDGGGPDAATFCARLERLTENDPFQAFGSAATPADIEAAFEALVDRADELRAVAPEDAAGASGDFASSAAAMRDLMADAGYAGDAVDGRAYRAEQQRYAEASQRLLSYLDGPCADL